MNALLPRLVNSATFLFFALSLAVKSGYSYGTALLLLAALITLPQWWPRRPHDAALRWLAFGFLFAGSVALLDVIRSGLGARGLEAPLKFFVVPLLLYFLVTVPPRGCSVSLLPGITAISRRSCCPPGAPPAICIPSSSAISPCCWR